MKNIFTISMIIVLNLEWNNTAQSQKIACGGWHSVVVCEDGSVNAFGENATGQLGNGANEDSSVPVSTGITNAVAVAAGGDQLEAHSLALKEDGTVWAWGSNIYGQLGNASTNNTSTPVQSILLSDIIAISSGGWHSVALKNDGTVWTWGWNTDGQLGDGTTTDRTIAGQVPGLTDVVKIAAGTYHVLALKSDGTVWAWGDNVSGQIGNGNNGTDSTSPVQVSGLSGIVHITSGRFFSLAVKDDGTVWTWGENLYGQLGNGTNNDSNVPVQVSGLTGITSAVAATGAFHCMAYKNDNTVWAWGRNTYGNLGDDTVDDRTTPVQMVGISDVEGMAAGTNFSLVFKTDGTLWGCGRNQSGQLGDGTFTQHNVLTQSNVVCEIFISTEETIEKADIVIYPNPSSTGIYQMNMSSLAGNSNTMSLFVYDLTGKCVKMQNINPLVNGTNIMMDLSEKADGIYLLQLKRGDAQSTYKLIKQ